MMLRFQKETGKKMVLKRSVVAVLLILLLALMASCTPDPYDVLYQRLHELAVCYESHQEDTDAFLQALEIFVQENEALGKETQTAFSSQYNTKTLQRAANMQGDKFNAIAIRLHTLNTDMVNRLRGDAEKMAQYEALMRRIR